jgi:hypothetical protein
MSETQRTRHTLRSVGAVFLGLVAVVVLSNGTDAVLHATGIYPPLGQPMADSLFLFATAYRIVYGIAGSYIAARFAPNRPMAHALVLGVIGVVLSIVGAAVTWNAGPEFGPRWYPLTLIVITMPCAWLGGKLFSEPSQVHANG